MFYYLMNLPQIKPRVDEGNLQRELNEKKTERPPSSINMQKMSTANGCCSSKLWKKKSSGAVKSSSGHLRKQQGRVS